MFKPTCADAALGGVMGFILPNYQLTDRLSTAISCHDACLVQLFDDKQFNYHDFCLKLAIQLPKWRLLGGSSAFKPHWFLSPDKTRASSVAGFNLTAN